MQNIWHVLPCGAMYGFKEHRYEDISARLTEYIWSRFPKAELEKLVPKHTVSRAKKEWTHRFYVKFMREVFRELIQEVLESNRIIIFGGLKMYIGRIPDNPNRITKARKKKLRWAVDDDLTNYALVLEGLEHSYYFRMRNDRRKELAMRINKGQNFH